MRVAHHLILSLILALAWALLAHAADVQTNVGSYETLQTLTTSTAVNCGNAARHRTVPVVGTGAAPVDLSALNPQIVAGTAAGQLCDIVGTSATATVTLGDGNGLTLTKGAGIVVLGLHQTLPIKWTGAIWVQRGPVFDLTDTYLIAPPSDINVTITTSGTGEFIYNGEEVLTPPLTFQSGSALWDGTFLDCDGFPPCVFQGPTLEYRIYENGGFGQNGWFDRTTGLRVSTGLDIAAGNIDTVSGDGLPITTDDGTTAKRTVHGVVNYCEDAGGDDAYSCNMLPALDRYVTGGLYFFKPTAFANVTGATIDFNGLGAKTIVKVAGGVTTALATNDIRIGQVVALQYDGTNMQLQSTLGNAASGSGDVVGDDTTTTAQNIVAYTGTGGKNITELTGTQGDVLYHTGTTWAKLAAGTSGNFLRTNGAGANPSWAAAAGGGAPTSKYFDAFALTPDGTNCVAGVITINSGPITDVITCADQNTSIIYGKSTITDLGGCPASTLNMSLHVYHGTTETITFAGDFSAMYRRWGGTDVINATWGTAVAADVAITTIHEIETATAAVTPNGTCTAGTTMLFWRYVVDATNFSANAANSRVLGVTIAHP